MIEIIEETLIDGLRLIPFLFVAFLIIEIIEHKLSNKNKKLIAKSGKYGPFIGSILGVIPQCGFSCLATNLFATRIITLGTLIAIYLSTSDEMLPILLSEKVDIKIILFILLIKVLVGMISGVIIDFVLRKKNKKIQLDYEICQDENCHCEKHLLLSVIKHTLSITFFIMLVTFILNIIIDFTGIADTDSIILNNIFTPFLTSLVGLIPNCASSVMITTLYTNNVISFASLISGLLTGSGVALIVLFRTNKNFKENLFILFLIYIIGSMCGLLLEIISLLM